MSSTYIWSASKDRQFNIWKGIACTDYSERK
uniref:Uncharacterized protein n=1 Tax=Arundo donax TaxID=35708 RepID=A0A0A9B0K6_ARUDO